MFQAFRDVIQFERANGTNLSEGPPAITDPETVLFCNDLVTEETDEFFEAMADGDLPKIADGIADSIWVLCVTAIRLGIDLPSVWEEVRRTNMAKFGPGSRRREDGKLLKPPGWIAPNLERALAQQMSLAAGYADVDDTGAARMLARTCSATS
jgi:predicted HAD superfamily Cof-like phosphohydrolase